MENAIEIANLYYHNLFANLSLCIKKNSFSVLAGPNNCGKTTLIRILNRELITEEDIEIMDQEINIYPIDFYSKLVSCIIPMEKIPQEINIEEELHLYSQNTKEIEAILKGLKIKKIIRKKIKDLPSKEFILYQIATTLIQKPSIILIDTISSYFTKKEMKDILSFLKEYQEARKITILYIARDLEESLIADDLYIMNEGKIALQGKPLEVLEKDNIINKIGLSIPFMIDLSVKLKDYDLIDKIELDKDRLVDKLWK